MSTTSQTRKAQTTRLYINTIIIKPKKPLKYPIYIGLYIDGSRVHKLAPIAEKQALCWDVDLPIDVGPQSQVTFQIKEVHRVRVWQGDLGSCILSNHPDWLRFDPSGTQREMVEQAEMFTISVKFSPPLGIEGTQRIAERAVEATAGVRDSILGKLGQARSAVETIISVLEHVEGIHPIAKATLGTLTKAFKFLEEEEQYDESIRELSSGMADMLSFAEAVNQHAKIVQLKDTIAQMMLMVEDASWFIIADRSSSKIGRTAIALVSPERRKKVDEYIQHFDTLRSGFDRGVTVQILDISSQLLRTVAATEERFLGEQERLLLRELPVAPSAGYDPNQCCMEGTRTMILHDIINWTTQTTGSTFLWVHGPAGAGKSSIAASTARELQSRKLLGAPFFCSRDKPELRDPALVLPTIAARLAVVFPEFGKAVANQLRQDPYLGGSAMQFQYEGLFALPLKKIQENGIAGPTHSLIIVIDGLDECGSPDTRTILLKYLLELSGLTNWLKIIVTSRPEADINRTLGDSTHCTAFPLPLDDTGTFNDILFFTKTRMAEIVQTKKLQPSDWPGKFKTEQLAELAGGLFIWAQTAYKFIASGYNPEQRLSQLLSKAPSPGIYSKLDALYATALAGAFQESASDNLEIFRQVVGIIVTVLSPLPVIGLVTLLQGRISEIEIRSVVDSFRSVLYEDEQNNSAIRVCHLSFIDFITDPSRCPLFFIDPQQHHTILANVSLQCMQEGLRFNICDLETSDLFNDQVPDLRKRVEAAIPLSLRYSCVHWMTHLRNSPNVAPLVQTLDHFLTRETVLFWIEALSLIGEIPASVHGLPLVVSWFEDPENACPLFIADIHRFILAFKEPITRSTPHLYISALPFAPTQSLISKRFLPLFPNTLSLDDQEPFWSPCLQTLEGHGADINSVAWAPHGNQLVSGSDDKTICIWDASTGVMVRQLRGHSDYVFSVAFSPSGRLVASGSWDGTVRVYDVETGVSILPPFLGHTQGIYCITFSPNGKHIASSSSDTSIHIWDVSTGKSVLPPFRAHSALVMSIAYSPDGTRIVSGSDDKTVRVWDVDTGRTILGPLTSHTSDVNTVDFSPDGQRILTGSRDSSIIIWDSTTGTISLGPLQVGRAVGFAKFSPDGRFILSTSHDSKIRIWDSESGIELYSQTYSGSIRSACFSPNGQHVVTGSSDRTVRIWELKSIHSSTPPMPDLWHTDLVSSVALSPDGKFIASGSYDKTVRLWHADTGIPACAPLRGHTGGVSAATFSPDGRHVLSASYDRTLRLWAAPTLETEIQTFIGHTNAVLCVAFSPNGQFFISGSHDRTIRFWNPATGGVVCEPLRGHQAAVTALVISSDGRLFASGLEDQTVNIWDSVTRQKLFDLPLRHGKWKVWSLAFSPDCQFIASYSNNGYIQLWDVHTQVVQWKTFLPGFADVRCCIFSQNGRELFCSAFSSIHILDSRNGSSISAPFEGHAPFITSLAVSTDGKRLISGSGDQTVRAWDIEFDGKDEDREELLPDVRTLSRPVGRDGWVHLRTGDPLLWIPSEYRNGLWKRAVLSIPPTAPNHPRTLDCSRFRHGTVWTEVRAT